jgi:ribonuclease HI
MPWIRATLKGQRVFVRATETGEPDAHGGKVEIRYKPNDGRLYHAMVKNLSNAEPALLPDDACGPAEAPAKTDSDKKRAPSNGAASSRAAGATLRDGDIIVYSDGACTGNPGPAGIGVVVVREKGRVELSEYLGQGTNNIAELTAVLRGIEEAGSEKERVVVHTDSQYAIGVLSKGWKAKANVELIAKIRERIRSRGNVAFVYVPGHAGVPLNERCDELARLAIKTRSNAKLDLAATERSG